MALTSTLGSPGIEIREVDNSYRLDSSTATTVYIPGFAAQGPVEQVMQISSVGDFELIYGKPTNAAERYFYYTVKAVLDGSGAGTKVLCSRLPYGAGEGDTVTNAYTLLAYPAIPVIKKKYDIKKSDGTIESSVVFDTDCYQPCTVTDGNSISKNDWKNFGNLQCKNTKDSSVVTPIEIAHDLILEKSKKSMYKAISNLKIDEGATLPKIGAANDNVVKPTISYKLVDKDDESVQIDKIAGAIAVEYPNDGHLLVHLNYTLTDNDKTSIGVFSTTLKYNTYKAADGNNDAPANSINYGKMQQYEFVVDSGQGVTFNRIQAFQIAESYNGQSKTQTNGYDFSKPKSHETNKDKSPIENSQVFTKDVTYLVGAPVTFQISLQEYYKLLTNESFKWSNRPYTFEQPEDWTKTTATVYQNTNDNVGSKSTFGLYEAIGHSAFIAINTSRSIITDNFEGFYLGVTDNTFSSPSSQQSYNAVSSIKITTDYFDVSSDEHGLMDSVQGIKDFNTLGKARLSFQLDSNSQGSISRVLTRNVTSKDISSTEFDDTINLALFKITKSVQSSETLKLNYSIREKYNWSFGKTRLRSLENSTQPVSYFVENVMQNSSNIGIMMNPYIADMGFVDFDGNVHGKIRILGNKLAKNLQSKEKKYLLREYTKTSSSSVNKNLLSPHKLAATNINSYKQLIAQAGLTPSLLSENFVYEIGDSDGHPDYTNFSPLNSIYPFGTYTTSTTNDKIIGQLPIKLQRALELVENDEEYPDIDLLVQGGLGTIYMYSNGNNISAQYSSRSLINTEKDQPSQPTADEGSTKQSIFDETSILVGIEDMRTSKTSLSDDAQAVIQDYRAVQNVFLQFANSMQNGGRGDTFFISDIPRGILIKGKDTKITKLFGTEIENNAYDFGETVVHSFPTSVYYPIKHQFDTTVSTYASVYAQWLKVLDNFSGNKVWIPISGYIAANIAATDAVHGPWYAAAGLRRGVISGALDYAISPNLSQRTDLYKICINSVPKIPNYGVTIWGIRTMGKKDSAFDQNTCRRTFLYMEKKIKQLMRYYLFQPNISYTRLQIFNEIDPFLESIQTNGGIYSYKLVCDTSNNTPDVINNGDLAVSIAAAPTRTAENIVVEFTANKYTEEVSSSEMS